MKKSLLLFFVILASLALRIFAQWTDTPKKDIVYSYLVYYSPGGTIFHKDTCKLKSGGTISVRDAISKGLKPCPECFPEAYPPSYVWTFSLESPAKSNVLGYSDGQMDIAFIISKTQIGIVIKNNSSSGAKINWDELSFISPINRASRVVHSGIRLVERNNAQAPTMIPPGSVITDSIIPSENISYNNGWEEGDLFSGDRMSYNGQVFGVYFPIEIGGKKKEYSFKFKITITQAPYGQKG
jgi:hypothetical protein